MSWNIILHLFIIIMNVLLDIHWHRLSSNHSRDTQSSMTAGSAPSVLSLLQSKYLSSFLNKCEEALWSVTWETSVSSAPDLHSRSVCQWILQRSEFLLLQTWICLLSSSVVDCRWMKTSSGLTAELHQLLYDWLRPGCWRKTLSQISEMEVHRRFGADSMYTLSSKYRETILSTFADISKVK